MSVSQVENTCKLKLHIPLPEMINSVFSQLGKKIEVAGTIYCDESNNPVHIDILEGESTSVYTPNNVINFHTHPVSAYNGGETVWGWPSGEDIRETIKFGLAGNKAHLVFTVEGLYTIQVNPCKLKKIKEVLNSEERGLLIFMIEEYFKTTHNFRGVDEVNGLAKKNIFITPYSFIDFANSFNLNNLLCATSKIHKNTNCSDISKIGHTGIHSEENNNIMKYSGLGNEVFNKIPNFGFPEVVKNNYIITKSAKYYIDQDDLDDLRLINEFGKEESFPKNKIKEFITKFKKISKYFDDNKCNDVWNSNPNTWFFINFFPSMYYVQKKYLNGSTFITPSKKLMNYVCLNHEPFIRIFSNQKDGCTIKTIGQKNKFKTIFHINSFGSNTLSIEQLCILFKIIMEYTIKNKKLIPKNINIDLKNKVTLSQIQYFLDYIKL